MSSTTGVVALPREVSQTLRHLWISHVNNVDIEYIDYLIAGSEKAKCHRLPNHASITAKDHRRPFGRYPAAKWERLAAGQCMLYFLNAAIDRRSTTGLFPSNRSVTELPRG